jgi:serine protease
VLIVVSAGNENGPVDAPANCPGVAAVAGLRHVGTKVGYSSFGPEVAVSAPAGNCVNTAAGAPCVYPITSTTNLGKTVPNGNDYTGQYSCDAATSGSYAGCTVAANQYRTPNLGTSFSAPIVSGIAALMAAVNGNLNSCQLVARLKEGATTFPQTSAGEATQPPICPQTAPNNASNAQECICPQDGSQCGAGMANASGAVAAALRPIAAVTLPTSVSAGKSISLNAQGSAAANGHTLSYQWSSVGAQSVDIQNGTSAIATVTAPSCGYATVQLTVTDDTGLQDTAEVVLSPTSATSAAPSAATSTTCSTPEPPVLAVCPATSSVQSGSGTQNFTATVANMTNTSVAWEVNGVAGGSATTGTISSSGVYTAPATVPSPATVTVEAISAADSALESSTNVTITAPPAKGGGGGAMDLMTLLVEALVLGGGLIVRRYSRRCAVSSQVFCARR